MWLKNISFKVGLRKCHAKPRSLSSASFVPKCEPHTIPELNTLKSIISASKRLFILTGAGISTESGIPDYRSEGVGLYARSSSRPVQFQQFMTDANIRKRYWARNFVGWPRFSSVLPNATHRCLSEWASPHSGSPSRVGCIVTQNVDRLHHKAGSQRVIELHGTAYRVVCMVCGNMVDRHEVQSLIEARNPSFVKEQVDIRPDGDVELSQEAVNLFRMPGCQQCGGILKPDIVFFGDNVPRDRVETIYHELETCDCLLGIGSSFQVFSSYRFLLEAQERRIPIVIVNIGPTRADSMAALKISRKCGDLFDQLKDLT